MTGWESNQYILYFALAFKLIEGNQAIFQKFVYLLGNVACIALALYKCKSMGLLPTHASDWLDFVEPPQRIEFSGGGLVFWVWLDRFGIEWLKHKIQIRIFMLKEIEMECLRFVLFS